MLDSAGCMENKSRALDVVTEEHSAASRTGELTDMPVSGHSPTILQGQTTLLPRSHVSTTTSKVTPLSGKTPDIPSSQEPVNTTPADRKEISATVQSQSTESQDSNKLHTSHKIISDAGKSPMSELKITETCLTTVTSVAVNFQVSELKVLDTSISVEGSSNISTNSHIPETKIINKKLENQSSGSSQIQENKNKPANTSKSAFKSQVSDENSFENGNSKGTTKSVASKFHHVTEHEMHKSFGSSSSSASVVSKLQVSDVKGNDAMKLVTGSTTITSKPPLPTNKQVESQKSQGSAVTKIQSSPVNKTSESKTVK
jgi:hypothetical protein